MKLQDKIVNKTAVDLGCGAGNDTLFLLQHDYQVTAVDIENKAIEMVKRRVPENAKLNFLIGSFENIKLPKADLMFANFCLFFCKSDCFEDLMRKITENINRNGYFVGNFLGKEDGWKEDVSKVFMDREEILGFFRDFEIVLLTENKYYKDSLKMQNKYWHVYNLIARKI